MSDLKTQQITELRAKLDAKIEEYTKNPDLRLKEALTEHNTNMSRSILKLNLNDKNVSFEELGLKLLYILNSYPEQAGHIFEKYEYSKLHKYFEEDKALWNEEYFLTQNSYLTLNFAFERIFHLAHVKSELFKQPNGLSSSLSSNTVDKFKHSSKIEQDVAVAKARSIFDKIKDFATENPKTVIAVVVIALIALIKFL